MPDAFFVAWLAEAARLQRDHHVLEIGAGSGFATAVLARLCARVVSLERYRILRTQALARLERLGLTNARIEWGDGSAPDSALGRFDRVVAHAALDAHERAGVVAMLRPGGALLCGEAESASSGFCVVLRVTASERDETAAIREPLGRARLRRLEAGLAKAL
jgi:protein-L-isoaspartate(D-aspartate) O-methyltransferase